MHITFFFVRFKYSKKPLSKLFTVVPTIVGVLHHKIVLTNTQHLHTSNARKFLWNVCLAFCLKTNDDGITSLATLTMIYTKLYSLYLDRKCSQQSAKPISFTPLLCPQNLLNFSKRQICKQKFFLSLRKCVCVFVVLVYDVRIAEKWQYLVLRWSE